MGRVVIIFILLSLSVQSQNWNVFNKGYRYNYHYNNAAIITNVLFVKTFSVSLGDTVYSMNNIAKETPSGLQTNLPQFLMKKIIKQADGIVRFEDTLNFKIVPTCTLNQTWVFSINPAVSATCIATETLSVFSVVDSVKTIVVNNADTIKLSKQFGLLQFPHLYGQNKYYRLTGIEKAGRYDSTSFYGERVPNAWDFYRFEVGDKRCIEYRGEFNNGDVGECKFVTEHFNSKSLLSNGYSYNIYQIGKITTGNIYWVSSLCTSSMCPFPSTSVFYSLCPVVISTVITENYVNLHKDSIYENIMYPGMLAQDYGFSSRYTDYVVKFGRDANGRFFKFFGKSCNLLSFTDTTSVSSSTQTPFYGVYFGEGLGKTSDLPYIFEGSEYYCVTSFVKGTQTYFNPFYTVNLIEKNQFSESPSIFPNPANSTIAISIENCKLFIYDVFGKAILIQEIESKRNVDVSGLPNGIYFVEIHTDSGKYSQKLLIQH